MFLLAVVAFVLLWSLAGWLAGRFFGRVRWLNRTGQWPGRGSLDTERYVTLGAFFALVVCASEVCGRFALPDWAKAAGIASTVIFLVASYRRGTAGSVASK